ncbi:MAG: integrase core domain-containing protein [Dehalococcoidia bacterium]|nr:integrase core domain-containing protein [Dehalococcoidia bacterium]
MRYSGNEILKRLGYVRERKYRHHTPPYTVPFLGCDQPNVTWSADYKGQFRTGNGRLCYPLTITDNCSRYLLGCCGLTRPTFEQTKPRFEWVFRQYGLPDAIRTDNGVPFASVGLAGLSKLSVWFIQLGIKPERIVAGRPEQNGRHERMHRTLKAETATPPKGNMPAQQKAFNRFQGEYNNERPHEALGQKTPVSVYRPSPHPFPMKPPRVQYDTNTKVRYVHPNGCIKWNGEMIYLSQSIAGETVGFHEIGDGLWAMAYSFHPLGILDEKRMKIQP